MDERGVRDHMGMELWRGMVLWPGLTDAQPRVPTFWVQQGMGRRGLELDCWMLRSCKMGLEEGTCEAVLDTGPGESSGYTWWGCLFLLTHEMLAFTWYICTVLYCT